MLIQMFILSTSFDKGNTGGRVTIPISALKDVQAVEDKGKQKELRAVSSMIEGPNIVDKMGTLQSVTMNASINESNAGAETGSESEILGAQIPDSINDKSLVINAINRVEGKSLVVSDMDNHRVMNVGDFLPKSPGSITDGLGPFKVGWHDLKGFKVEKAQTEVEGIQEFGKPAHSNIGSSSRDLHGYSGKKFWRRKFRDSTRRIFGDNLHSVSGKRSREVQGEEEVSIQKKRKEFDDELRVGTEGCDVSVQDRRQEDVAGRSSYFSNSDDASNEDGCHVIAVVGVTQERVSGTVDTDIKSASRSLTACRSR
ncbi:hypothetical protein Q3G72_027224 [Acer saccharum]|nr:hypothetical protein Q3G72_027224 [Acer saccharum]